MSDPLDLTELAGLKEFEDADAHLALTLKGFRKVKRLVLLLKQKGYITQAEIDAL